MPINLQGQIIGEKGNPTGGQVNLNTGQMTSPNITSPVTGQTITASDLASSPALNYKTPSSSSPESIAGLTIPQPMPPLEAKAENLTAKIQDIQNSLLGKEAFERQQQQQFGIPEKNQAILDYSTRLSDLQKKEAIIKTEYGGALAAQHGVLEPFVTGEKDARLRQNAVEALTISANIDAMHGLITSAQSKVDRAVQEKYGPDEEKLKIAQENLNTLIKSGSLTREQERQAENQKLVLKQKELEIAQAKQNATDIWNIATNAATNINSFKPNAEYATAAEALKAIQTAKTKEAALQIAVNTGLTKQPIGQSDFEQAFLREKGRLPTLEELLNYKKQLSEIKPAKNEPLDILDIQRYQEIYPDAGIVAGDTKETANHKVAILNQPKEFSDEEFRTALKDDLNNNKTYEQVIADIKNNPKIKNKNRALLIAGELYGKSKVNSAPVPKVNSTPVSPITPTIPNISKGSFFENLNKKINNFFGK